MGIGRRFLRDMSDSWPPAPDRLQAIHDARTAFVHASGVAQTMGDVRRQVLTEVAIAGYWLWVPCLPDVMMTLQAARDIVEDRLLLTPFGARGKHDTELRTLLSASADLCVWVECAGIHVQFNQESHRATGLFKIPLRRPVVVRAA